MIWRKFLWAAGLTAGILACSGPSVQYDFDAKADFTRFHAYDWLPAPPQAGARGGTFDNAIMEGRVHRAVDAGFAAKGFPKVAEGAPADFLVACYPLRQSTKSSQPHLGLGLGFGPVGVGVGAPVGERNVETIGALAMEIQDARTRTVVWKGTAQSALRSSDTPEEADDAVRRAVTNLLKRFPPSGR